MISLLIFDWGDTIMVDFAGEGPMHLWRQVAWIPGAEEALRQLTPVWPCVIATSASHSGTEEMILSLKRVGAEKYFSRFFSSRELGYAKPDPRFFLAVAGKMEADTGRCVMIGNHYQNDIEGAKNAGMRTVFYNHRSLPGDFPMADRVITGMSMLPEALFNMENSDEA
jgi:putative hydrolase of the HAD superfamily